MLKQQKILLVLTLNFFGFNFASEFNKLIQTPFLLGAAIGSVVSLKGYFNKYEKLSTEVDETLNKWIISTLQKYEVSDFKDVQFKVVKSSKLESLFSARAKEKIIFISDTISQEISLALNENKESGNTTDLLLVYEFMLLHEIGHLKYPSESNIILSLAQNIIYWTVQSHILSHSMQSFNDKNSSINDSLKNCILSLLGILSTKYINDSISFKNRLKSEKQPDLFAMELFLNKNGKSKSLFILDVIELFISRALTVENVKKVKMIEIIKELNSKSQLTEKSLLNSFFDNVESDVKRFSALRETINV